MAMKVEDVVVDFSILPRRLDLGTVDEYVESLQNGDTFPAITLEPRSNRLLDGLHRLKAHQKAGISEIEVVFREIPADEPPKLFTLSLSVKHGTRISYEDRKGVARQVYEDNPSFDQQKLARLCGVHRETIGKWLKDLTEKREEELERERQIRRMQALLLKEAGWSQRKIAELLRVSQKQVSTDVGSDTGTHFTEDQLWQAGLDLQDQIDVGQSVSKIMSRRLEHILTAFSQPAAKARILAKETLTLAEKYKTYEDHQNEREAVAQDMRRIAEYYSTISSLILDPSYTTVTQEALDLLLER